MKPFLLIGLAGLVPPDGENPARQPPQEMAPAANVHEPPSAAKLELIRRFLRATGVQDRIDSGALLDHQAENPLLLAAERHPGGPISLESAMRRDIGEGRRAALRQAFAKHRAGFQEQYERHVNWEFAEDELRQIVTFLESPAGRHLREGQLRMQAYVGSNTEDWEAQIVQEAAVSLAGQQSGDD